MFTSIAQQITDSLEQNGCIRQKEKAICFYGLKQLFVILLNFSTTILFSAVIGEIWQGIVFTVFFMPLRQFAGGFHAKTPFRCYVYSSIMIVLVLLLLQLQTERIILISAFSSIVILLLSPVGDRHKPLDVIEYKVYRKRTALVLILEDVLLILLLLHKWNSVASVMSMAIFSVGILVIMGKIKNRFEMR